MFATLTKRVNQHCIVVHWKFRRKYKSVSYLFSCTVVTLHCIFSCTEGSWSRISHAHCMKLKVSMYMKNMLCKLELCSRQFLHKLCILLFLCWYFICGTPRIFAVQILTKTFLVQGHFLKVSKLISSFLMLNLQINTIYQ